MKTIVGLALVAVFVIGLVVGIGTPTVNAAGFCYYTCDCAGNGLRCCITPFGTFCKPDPDWNCPQVYNC